MSCDSQIRGRFTFSKSNMPKVAKEMRDLYNQRQDYFYQVALAIHSIAKSEKLKSYNAVYDYFILPCGNEIKNKDFPYSKFFTIDKFYLKNLLKTELFSNNNDTLRKPRKSFFKKVTNADKVFTFFCMNEVEFEVNSLKCTIEVDTGYNNRSDSDLDLQFEDFFISKIKNRNWGTHEGGFLMYRDEDSYEDNFDLDSPDYDRVQMTCGGIGKKMEERNKKYHLFMSR